MERCNCPTCQSYEAARQQPVLTRIADALEKIAKELRRRNELEARRQRQNAGHEMYHEQIDEIMEG